MFREWQRRLQFLLRRKLLAEEMRPHLERRVVCESRDARGGTFFEALVPNASPGFKAIAAAVIQQGEWPLRNE